MSTGAFEDDGDAIIEMDLLPPRWVDVQDEVGDVLKDVTLKSKVGQASPKACPPWLRR